MLALRALGSIENDIPTLQLYDADENLRVTVNASKQLWGFNLHSDLELREDDGVEFSGGGLNMNAGGSMLDIWDKAGFETIVGNTGRQPSCSRCMLRADTGFAPSDPFAPPTPEGWPAVWDCGDFAIFTPSDSTAQYTAMGEPFETQVFGIEAGIGLRQYQWVDEVGDPDIDEFGRPLSMAITSVEEWGGGVSRTLFYTDADAAGIYTRTDQDGVITTTTLDDLNRVSQVSMVNGAQSMTVDYTYYANGLVQSITYSNGTHILYEYDAAGRVSRNRAKLSKNTYRRAWA